MNGTTGKLLWYQQVTSHDLRDHDFQDSPIVTTQRIHGARARRSSSGKMLIVGAGAPKSATKTRGEIVAYSLP